MPVISSLGRLGQEDCKIKATPGYVRRSSLKKEKKSLGISRTWPEVPGGVWTPCLSVCAHSHPPESPIVVEVGVEGCLSSDKRSLVEDLGSIPSACNSCSRRADALFLSPWTLCVLNISTHIHADKTPLHVK